MSYDPIQASRDYQRIQQENEHRLREMQQAEDRRRYEETQREMQRRNEEMKQQWIAQQRVTDLILQQSHETTSYSSDSSYSMSQSELQQRKAIIHSIPAMCKPYEDRLLALIEQKYIELKSEHDKFRSDFLSKNPGQEMRCKPLMNSEKSFLGITFNPSDRDKWYSIILGEYLRSLQNTDDGRKMGTEYSGHVEIYSSVDGKTEYKICTKCDPIYNCSKCTGLAYRTKLSKYYVFNVRSPLYENGRNKRAPLSNTVSTQAPNFTIVNGQMVRTQPMFQPLPPHLRWWSYEPNGNINYDSIDGLFTNDKMRKIYRG